MVSGVNSTKDYHITGKVTLQINFRNSESSCKATFYVVPCVTKQLPERKIDLKGYKQFTSLPLADPNFHVTGDIEALFGINIWIKIVQSNIIRSGDDLVLAQDTKLGYIIVQSEDISEEKLSKRAVIAHLLANAESVEIDEVSTADVHRSLQKFWEIEDLPKQIFRSSEEKYCEDFFERTHYRQPDGRYVVHMPLNDKIQLLGRSKRSALKQFFSMERKMLKSPTFRTDYINFMRTHEECGFMTKIHETEESGYYTPHHGVYSSNKFRTVFNASASTSTGISLNECQLVGPKLQDDLAVILMRFRTTRIALSADVKQMYCQVAVDPRHREYQKILWRESTEQPVGVYELNRVAYGQASAPFLAIAAMQQNARDYEHQYPIGAKHVLKAFYVDDFFSGADTISETMKIYEETTGLLNKGKFQLAKWCSNAPELNKIFNATPSPIKIEEEEAKSVLGLQWLPLEDVFTYKVSKPPYEHHWTKRKILSQVGKLYDPNGFIGPILIVAKVFIQSLWKLELDWDEHVPEDLDNDWERFLCSIPQISDIKIPRWLGMAQNAITELHGFCDASEMAYAAVIYARTIHPNGEITIQLIQSKTRVAPLKKLTIPRLELCGAYLLTQLMTTIRESLSLQTNSVYFWCDSEITLQWIRKSPSDLKTFVANRVAAIQNESTERGFDWRWVPTADNPADLASRGEEPSRLQETSLWWNGPDWLNQPKENWPKTNQYSVQH